MIKNDLLIQGDIYVFNETTWNPTYTFLKKNITDDIGKIKWLILIKKYIRRSTILKV